MQEYADGDQSFKAERIIRGYRDKKERFELELFRTQVLHVYSGCLEMCLANLFLEKKS